MPTEPDIPDLDLEGDSGKDVWASSTDLGVDFYRNLDDTSLNHILNFPDGKPALFAGFRSKSRICSWDPKVSHLFVEGNEDMLPLSLLWHQRVGIAALVEKVWMKAESPGGVPGVLIADEVGVGKTALIMGTIAFVIDAYWVDQLALGSKGKIDSIPAGLDRSKVRKAPILGESPDRQWVPLDSVPCCVRSPLGDAQLHSYWPLHGAVRPCMRRSLMGPASQSQTLTCLSQQTTVLSSLVRRLSLTSLTS
jgi:hypothetical protein